MRKFWPLLLALLSFGADAALVRTTHLGATSAEGVGDGGYTTSAFTPANNSLLVVIASHMTVGDGGAEGSVLTIADSAGLTWTSRAVTTTSPGWSYGIRAWTAPVTTGVSMTVTIDAGAENVYAYLVDAFDYTGYDTGSPIGATIVGSDADGNGAASITLSGAPASTSDVLATATRSLSGTAGTVTHGTGWSEISDRAVTDWIGMQTQSRTGSTSTTVAWDDLDVGGTPVGATLLALEIKAAAGGGSSGLLRRRRE